MLCWLWSQLLCIVQPLNNSWALSFFANFFQNICAPWNKGKCESAPESAPCPESNMPHTLTLFNLQSNLFLNHDIIFQCLDTVKADEDHWLGQQVQRKMKLKAKRERKKTLKHSKQRLRHWPTKSKMWVVLTLFCYVCPLDCLHALEVKHIMCRLQHVWKTFISWLLELNDIRADNIL